MAFREPLLIRLELPVEDFGKMIDSVTISRHATGADMDEVDHLTELGATKKYIELLCGVSMEAIQTMFQGDITAINAAMLPFVSRTPPPTDDSGATSPAPAAGPPN